MTFSRFKLFQKMATRLALGAGLWLTSVVAHAEYGLNFQKPVTGIGHRLLELHNMILIICVVIFIGVFAVMFYSIAMHRKSRGVKPAKFSHSTTLEIVWTTIPFVILIGMAIPSTATLLEMEDVSKSELTVKITGYQWKWQYELPDHDVSFFSNLSTPPAQIDQRQAKIDPKNLNKDYLLEVDNPLVLPIGKKVRFVVTANDVIHAWWVPAFGVKKDAIPGFINEMWTKIDEPGTYRGQCAELCGKDHGYMPIVVNAVSEDDFNKWVAAQKEKTAAAQAASGKTWTKDELMARGKTVYAQCGACHGMNGEGVGPFPKLAGSKIAIGPAEGHIKIVLNGKPGTAMQAYAAQMNDADIAAVVTFERNAFGNNKGDAVQPGQVKALR